MDQSAFLRITDKGTDEVAHRTFKLGIKLRSVLLLLHQPHSVQVTIQKSVFPKEEIVEAIDALVQQGFVTVEAAPPDAALQATAAPAAPKPAPVAQPAPAQQAAATPAAAPKAAAASDSWDLEAEIILSEAKFLLIDFCVECFGMQSESLTDDIRACKSVNALSQLLRELIGLVKKQKPDQLIALQETVRKINETA